MAAKNKFSSLTFDDFKKLAKDEKLSKHEKIGFPNEMRASQSKDIFNDICLKLPQLRQKDSTVIDIGIGCGTLSQLIIENSKKLNQQLIANDSDEMLKHLKDVIKIPGQFPHNIDSLKKYKSKVDAIVCYSVIQYVHPSENVFLFIDAALSLLKSGGSMLIGDVPNFSMRNRLLLSPTGIAYHQKYMKTDSLPEPLQYKEIGNDFDDALVSSVWMHYRLRGYNVFIMPQPNNLPMANRREDILICKL